MSNRDFPTSTFIFCFRIEFFFKYLEEYLIRGNDSWQIGIKQRRINTFSATMRREKTNSNKLVYCILFPREISLRVNTRNLEDFHATLQSGRREEIVHFQIVMQHLFTTASDQSDWSSRAIQSCQRKRATSFEWQGLVISRNSSSMIRDRPWSRRWKIVLGSRVI